MEDKEKCPEYDMGNARKSYLFRNPVFSCDVSPCPYNKGVSATLNGERINFCKSKGLLKKTEIENPPKIKKSEESDNFNLLAQADIINGNASNIVYL